PRSVGPRGSYTPPSHVPSSPCLPLFVPSPAAPHHKYPHPKPYCVYYFSRIKKTWNKSESFCTTVNAHLVTVSSAQEFLAREAGNESYWIGLTDAFTEGTWRWVDGTEYRQDPEDSNLWNDKPCSASLRWICARSLDADGL
uniref:C-type lectin domain-containing protein n=1 Tax=Nothoprocta perdicaria TaxID=30464 RepID=A0A8C7ED37_NOTPE